MPQVNVEVVRRILEANRSDGVEAAIETAIALSDPSVEFTPVMAAVEPQTYRGHDSVPRYFRDMAESWQAWHNEVEEVIQVGPGTVLATFRSHLVGRDSGVTVEARRTGVFELSDGKMLRGRIYPDREAALEALGLRG
jgi:ketosteroid isomerase-like protein